MAPTPHTDTLQLDYSCANESNDCERYYYNRYRRHLIPADAPVALPLDFGECLHKARELLTTGISLNDIYAYIDDNYGRVFTDAGMQGIEPVRTPHVAKALLCAYTNKYGWPRDTHTEVGLRLDMGSFLFHGRVDYTTSMSGVYTVADLKTTSGIRWLPQPRLNWQLVGYAYGVQELTGDTVEQVAIDGLVLPPRLKRTVYDDIPLQDLAARLQDNLHMRTASVQPRDIDEWRLWLTHRATVIQYCIDREEWPMRAPRACERFNKTCEYDCLCKAPNAEMEERLVEALFRVQEWRPFSDGDGDD